MSEKLIVHPAIVLREEFDDWAMLYDVRSGEVYGLNPIGVFVWKLLDGKHTLDDIMIELRKNCDNLPEKAQSEIEGFIKVLKDKALVGTEV